MISPYWLHWNNWLVFISLFLVISRHEVFLSWNLCLTEPFNISAFSITLWETSISRAGRVEIASTPPEEIALIYCVLKKVRHIENSIIYWAQKYRTKKVLLLRNRNALKTLLTLFLLSRFRTCLKMADSPDANIVGKIFFNIVQSKCFILKPEKYCKQRSWWGECLKKGIRKRAHLRDNRKY